jgi:starch phosphorylase
MTVEQRDAYEAESLYSVLESEIIPMFFNRNSQGMPVEWIQKIKSSIINLAGYFSTERMVKEYAERAYMKAIEK